MLFSVGAELIIPLLIKEIIDAAFIKQDYMHLKLLLGEIFVLAIISGGMNFLSRISSEFGAQKTVKKLRNDVFDSLINKDVQYFMTRETGQLLTRTTADVEAIRRLLSVGTRISLQGTMTYLGIIFLLWKIDVSLVMIVIIMGVPLLFLMLIFGKRVGPLFMKQRIQFGDLSNIVQETLEGISVVKSYRGEPIQKSLFHNSNRKYFDLQMKTALERARFLPVLYAALGFMTAGVIFFGGNAVISGVITVGSFVAFITYLTMLIVPTRFVAWFLVMWEQAKAGAKRLHEIFSVPEKVKNSPNAIKIKGRLNGEIIFENVYFSYDGVTPVLNGLNMHINPGEKVAILGAIGSGKTSIVNLIPRFYDPQKGVVKIDGINIKKYDLRSLRRQISFVSQDTFLFSTTIKENIAFGKPDATMEEIIEAAKIAQLHDFIMKLPDKYDTIVGERGIKISGGQRQRVAIARAVLVNSSILILDDTTSSIDSKTERELQKALWKVMEGKTVIIITQRIGNLRFADKIFLVDNGKVVESGTHEELLNKKGLYWEIYVSRTLDPKIAEAIIKKQSIGE